MENAQYGQEFHLMETNVIADVKGEKSHIHYAVTPFHGNVLLMDGEIQLATSDEYRYHESLVHPIMQRFASMQDVDVLILGGGDGCAAREVFKWTNVRRVTIVDWDSQFVALFGQGYLSGLNKKVYERKNCEYVCEDALDYINHTARTWDVVFVDLPDPDGPQMKKLYTDILTNIPKVCKIGSGGVALHMGPACLNYQHPNWSVISECRDTLLRAFTKKVKCWDIYTTYVPSFSNEWAFMWLSCVEYITVGTGPNVDMMCKYWNSTKGIPKSPDITKLLHFMV